MNGRTLLEMFHFSLLTFLARALDLAIGVSVFGLSSALLAQTAPTDSASVKELAGQQNNTAERYGRLEALLLRSAQLEAVENPSRAALLQQAVQLGKQAQLAELMVKAASNLESKQYTEAIERQKATAEGLARVLALLQSENREQRIREQRDEIRRWIEETDRLLRLQSSLRGRTEGGQDEQAAAADQGKLIDKASEISSQLQGDSADEKSADEKSTDQSSEKTSSEQNGNSTPDSGQPTDQETNREDSEPKDGAAQEANQIPSKENESGSEKPQGKPDSQQDKPQDGQPSASGNSPESQDESNQESQEQSQDPTQRAKQRVNDAKERMQEAEEALKNAQRAGAIEKQRAAEEELRAAIEELEEILRQLREEEIERSLASLDSRLRRMLEMQTKVLEETKRLQEISGSSDAQQPTARQVTIRASNLALDERKILAEGERAYLLLREEGSSAAFPEAIEQVNTDIDHVAKRLSDGDIGPLTLVIEEEIVTALEEMVSALAQIQKEKQDKKNQPQGGQGQPQGEQGDQPLVDKLAELRLVRTLQARINNRTQALAKMLADPQDPIGQVIANTEISGELQGLANRQSNLQQVTRDIVAGRTE
ncbi:MAG: hypothetical protein KDB03_03810 [Planctomycetales bacterium]|nr:hypothetical protein [Planctomycetales bacterium]